MNITDFIQIPRQNRQLLLYRGSYLTKHQTLAGIIQNRLPSIPGFFKNTMCKSAKAQHIDIHNSTARTFLYEIRLRLHGELIRHQKQEITVRILRRHMKNVLMKSFAFSGTGWSKIKL